MFESSRATGKRKKNSVHDFFTKIDNITVRCRVCLKTYKNHGNTTNLANHMQRMHLEHVDAEQDPAKKKSCLSQIQTSRQINEKEQENDDPTIIEPRLSETTDLNSITRSRSFTSKAPQTPPRRQQATINKAFDKVRSFTEGGDAASKITNTIVYMIAVDRQPFSIVEDKGFRKLLNTTVPLYSIPCRKTITQRTDEKFKLLSAKVQVELSKVGNLSLTTDIWTDPFGTRSYIALTAHYIQSENMQLEAISLGMKELDQGHSSEYLSTILVQMLDEWHIQNTSVVAVVSDNAANITRAIYNTFGSRRHLPCFAHTLNLAVQNCITATPEFKTVVKKVKMIVTFFKRSVKAADGLREVQKSDLQQSDEILKLKQECETRWNSLYYMIQRFIKLANCVSTVLMTLPRKKDDGVPDMVTHAELQILKDSVAILAPVETVTTEMSGETYVTCSKIIPIVNCLIRSLEKLETEHNVSENLRLNMLKELKKRFQNEESNIEKNSILAVATLLDPRFKKIHFRNALAVSTAISKISRMMKDNKKEKRTIISTSETINKQTGLSDPTNLWGIHDELLAASSSDIDEPGGIPVELRQFLNAEIINRMEDPLQSWQKLKDIYPNLYEIAMKYYVVVGTSVPSERLFSAAGDIISAKRSRLTGKRAPNIIFLGSLPERVWT